MNLGGYTATGPRDANEDNYYVVDFSEVRSFTNGITSFVMVSDGMGGYQGGDVASGLAVSSAESYISQLLDMAEGNQIELDAEYALNEISQNAHEAILTETRERGSANMGATFVGAFLSPTHAWIGHVGDSRAYLIRNGEARQLTEDHSQVGRMLSRGLITEEEAQSHPARNRIERALGFSDATPEVNEVDLELGDILLLCSDGVYTVLDSAEIGECIGNARNAENAATRVVKTALTRGTDDNSTAVVALNMSPKSARAGTGRRKAQPTIRTSIALRSRYGTANRRQPGQRPSARELAAGKRPAWAVAIPVAVLIALIAVFVFVLLPAAGGQGTNGGSGAGDQGSLTVPEVQQQASSSAAPAASSAASSSAQPMGTSAVYTVTSSDAVLKYVDASGEAHRFSEAPFNAPDVPLASGSSVTADASTSSFGIEGRNYRALSNAYKADLLSDCESYASGVTSFNSSLSQVMADQDAYRGLLQTLSTYGSSNLSAVISKLIVDEDCLSQQ